MENVMSTKVFGTPDSPSKWYFPRSGQEGEVKLYSMCDIRLTNTQVCEVILCMNMNAEVFILDKTRRDEACCVNVVHTTVLQCMLLPAQGSIHPWSSNASRMILTIS
jgi:hypothetical protein